MSPSIRATARREAPSCKAARAWAIKSCMRRSMSSMLIMEVVNVPATGNFRLDAPVGPAIHGVSHFGRAQMGMVAFPPACGLASECQRHSAGLRWCEPLKQRMGCAERLGGPLGS